MGLNERWVYGYILEFFRVGYAECKPEFVTFHRKHVWSDPDPDPTIPPTTYGSYVEKAARVKAARVKAGVQWCCRFTRLNTPW